MKTGVVITGSTRGLGFCLAREFLSRGCAVVISGRSNGAVDAALSTLRRDFPSADIHGFPCDTGEPAQVQALWDKAAAALGRVDHWINNAGIGQPQQLIWELAPDAMEQVVRTDLLGVLYGARVAMQGMMRQNGGAIWLMEGHGSDGSHQEGPVGVRRLEEGPSLRGARPRRGGAGHRSAWAR